MRLHNARIVMASLLGLLPVFAGCATRATDDGEGTDPRVTVSHGGALARSFAQSASSANVPRDLLVAISKVEDGLAIPADRIAIDIENEVPAAGPLQLRRGKLDTLRRAAELSQVSEVDLRMHADLALEAGARVLAELGAQKNASPSDLASWSEAVAEMSGYADDANREHYVHQVFALLARGGSFVGRDGEVIELPAHRDLPPSLTIDVSFKVHTNAGAQFAGAQWIPTSCTNKCTLGRAGNAVKYVVIHDTEGGWNASVATLQNDPDKSVHYIVGEDGKVAQFVTEETTAWHAGNFSYNQRSVGIEHVGYATKPFPEAEYAASAKLVDYLLTKYNLPRDREHVIGHDQIPNGTKISETSPACSTSPKQCEANVNFGGASHHTDPGVWEWATFMPRVKGAAKCNDVTNLWNCSNDKKKAFRCANDKVEVLTCDGLCEVKPNGVDDYCKAVTPQSSPVSSEGATGGAAGSTPGGSESPNPAGPGTEGSAQTNAGFLPAADQRQATDSSGCSASPASSSSSSTGALLALAAGAVVLGRRRKSRM